MVRFPNFPNTRPVEPGYRPLISVPVRQTCLLFGRNCLLAAISNHSEVRKLHEPLCPSVSLAESTLSSARSESTPCLLRNITRRPKHLQMKEGSHGRRKSKKAVYSQMLKLRCVGPFLAKNMMHLWKKSSKQRLFPDDKTYSEHGPGARAAINVARQWPPTANLYSSSDSARQIYNQCCDDWRRKRQCFARVRATHLRFARQRPH